jgi:hypothetical protein
MKAIVSGVIEGIRNRRIGSTIREVLSEENVPVDIQKMKLIQRKTGTQYLKIRTRFIVYLADFFVVKLKPVNFNGFTPRGYQARCVALDYFDKRSP